MIAWFELISARLLRAVSSTLHTFKCLVTNAYERRFYSALGLLLIAQRIKKEPTELCKNPGALGHGLA